MRPDSGGYHKRLDFFASPSGVQRQQAEKQIDSSRQRLLKAHEVLTTHITEPNGSAVRPHPDERALTMYQAATAAIEAFARENQGDLGRFTFARLVYFDTDILRKASGTHPVVPSVQSLQS